MLRKSMVAFIKGYQSEPKVQMRCSQKRQWVRKMGAKVANYVQQ
jgi:hypothetical protein